MAGTYATKTQVYSASARSPPDARASVEVTFVISGLHIRSSLSTRCRVSQSHVQPFYLAPQQVEGCSLLNHQNLKVTKQMHSLSVLTEFQQLSIYWPGGRNHGDLSSTGLPHGRPATLHPPIYNASIQTMLLRVERGMTSPVFSSCHL